jgi:predicted secreted protein
VRTLRVVLAVLLPLTLLAACGGDDDDSASATTTTASGAKPTTTVTKPTTTVAPWTSTADHEVTGKDNPATVDMKVGETLDVELESCPSCGYHWELEKTDDPSAFGPNDTVEMTGEEDVNPTATAGQTGGSVTHVTHFTARSAAAIGVSFGYFPPGKTEPEEEFIVTVYVTA